MTILTATAEAGTNGATVTTGTFGSDDPWDAVVAGSGTTTFSTEQSIKGTTSYKVAFSASTDAQYMEWVPPDASRTAAARIYLRISGSVTGSFQFFTFHKADGSAKQLGVELLSTGAIRIQNAVSALVGTSSANLAADTWYRMEIAMDNSGGTSAGAAEIRFYEGDSATEVTGLSFSLTGQNFGANVIGAMRVGRFGTNSATATLYFDDVGYEDSTLTFLGPSGASVSRPDSDTSNAGSWTVTGGVTAAAVLADDSDNTFIESPDNPQTPCARRVHLSTLSPGPVVVTTRAAATAASPATSLTVRLLQDTTVIATWTWALTTTPADYVGTLSAGENATITDRSALYVEFDADAA